MPVPRRITLNSGLSALLSVALALTAFWTANGAIFFSEILFNPPANDTPNEYVELRGAANEPIPSGTWLVAVGGDKDSNPGTIENVFDLGGTRVGGNGYLCLLQRETPYTPDAGSFQIVNVGSGEGWGSGASSSIGHTGRNSSTELKNHSVTYFLVQSATRPTTGNDIDANNDGALDSAYASAWRILDSVGVLGTTGAGDIAYGAVNFRRNTSPGNGAKAPGTVIPVGFTPRYVARSGNNSGYAREDWVGGDDLVGTAPNWKLVDATKTYPATLAGAALNHLGRPNFGAPGIPGVLTLLPEGGLDVPENGVPGAYQLALNTVPSGPVTVEITAPPSLEVSAGSELVFSRVERVALTGTKPVTVSVRAVNDSEINRYPGPQRIEHALVASGDPAQYPLTMLAGPAEITITDDEVFLLNEVRVNPPGTNDVPWEFIELRGTPGSLIHDVQLLVLNGESNSDPGTVAYSRNLNGTMVGANGMILLAPPGFSAAIPEGTRVLEDSALAKSGGGLDNGSISLLLVSSETNFPLGLDLDEGSDGFLEGLPGSARILDGIAWTDGGGSDRVYGEALLKMAAGLPDAATRVPGDLRPNTAAAWIFGDLAGSTPDTMVYDPQRSSSNLPPGAALSPGAANRLPPRFEGLMALAGTIGDPSNPVLRFFVGDAEADPAEIKVSATSTNPAVLPNSGITIAAGAGGERFLRAEPAGVGYSDIVLLASNAWSAARGTVSYAASAPGRPGGVWHYGASDGSTAIPGDTGQILLGDDENQVLRSYARNLSGYALQEFDMTEFLDLPDIESGQPREVDVEASTRVGARIYWMGSHGHAAIGEVRTNRTRVFATDLSVAGGVTTLTYAGRYDFLKEDLIRWDSSNGHGRGTNYYGLAASDADGVPPKAPDGSGFAIEGLTMLPGSSTAAYVAFRAPIVSPTNRLYALLVPVLNFSSLTTTGAGPGSAVFGAPVELDLYGRGVRSIECGPQGCILVAGPPFSGTADYPQDFRLYTWSGAPGDMPEQRTADLTGINPEGIVDLPPGPWTEASVVELLSDNGTTIYYGDDVQAKQLSEPRFKKCRRDAVALGAITLPEPIITRADLRGGLLRLEWRSLRGLTYRVQTARSLAPGDWADVSDGVLAQGPFTWLSLPVTGLEHRFARIAVRN